MVVINRNGYLCKKRASTDKENNLILFPVRANGHKQYVVYIGDVYLISLDTDKALYAEALQKEFVGYRFVFRAEIIKLPSTKDEEKEVKPVQ